MNDLEQLIDATLSGLGYELVDLERGPHGLLRVFIDVPPSRQEPVNIDDCERVSRQLTHVFMVDDIDYGRLEVSSPGVDRVLKRERDFNRFVGEIVKVRLRDLFEGRRNFEGVLTHVQSEGADAPSQTQWALEYEGRDGELMQMVFELHELESARLAPVVSLRKDGLPPGTKPGGKSGGKPGKASAKGKTPGKAAAKSDAKDANPSSEQ